MRSAVGLVALSLLALVSATAALADTPPEVSKAPARVVRGADGAPVAFYYHCSSRERTKLAGIEARKNLRFCISRVCWNPMKFTPAQPSLKAPYEEVYQERLPDSQYKDRAKWQVIALFGNVIKDHMSMEYITLSLDAPSASIVFLINDDLYSDNRDGVPPEKEKGDTDTEEFGYEVIVDLTTH